MLRPQIQININGTDGRAWEFTYVNDCTIEWNRDNFTRSANIKLPVRFYVRNERIFEQVQIGDMVTIAMGYYPNLVTRFVGYIAHREPNSPLELRCEDESWQYKQRFIKPVTFKDTTIQEIIEGTYTGVITQIGVGDTKIGDWAIKDYATFIRVLDTLRQSFGITAYWDNNKGLNVNAQFTEVSIEQKASIFDFNKNIITTQGLDFQEAAEFSQMVLVRSEQDGVDADGKPLPPLEVWAFYNPAGVITTVPRNPELPGNLNTFNEPYQTLEAITTIAKTWLANLNFTGFTGSFLTFGEPVVEVNDDCRIINKERKSMEGRYRIKGVNVRYGVNAGYRQDIELARKTG